MNRYGVIGLAAAWQFVYMVDFIAPLPLGAVLSRELRFAAEQTAWLSVSYTLASLMSGLVSSWLVGKLGRQRIVGAGMALFVLANLLASWADTLPALLACRALAGLAGAPVTATLMAVVIDASVPARRGQAIASVMSGATLAVVAGVPLALSVSNAWGWPTAFQLLGGAGLGMLCVLGVMASTAIATAPSGRQGKADGAAFLQSRTGAAQGGSAQGDASGLLAQPAVQWACGLQALSQFATFLLIPVLSTYLVVNLGIELAQLPWLYAAGGLGALACMRLAGRATDRWGHAGPLRWACIMLAAAVGVLAMPSISAQAGGNWFVMAAFVVFMAANAAKNVALATHTAGLAPPARRAAFMNLQSSAQDIGILAAGLGPVLMLTTSPKTGHIEGLPMLAGLAGVLVLLLGFARQAGVRAPARPSPAP